MVGFLWVAFGRRFLRLEGVLFEDGDIGDGQLHEGSGS
jgi:hypothetical protein